MNYFRYKDEIFEYEIVKSSRKTISIAVLPDGRIVLRAPQGASDSMLNELMVKKAEWAAGKWHEMKKRKEVDREKILYRGKEYPVFVVQDNKCLKTEIKLRQDRLVISADEEQIEVIQTELEKWLQRQAEKMITERVKYFSRYIKEPFCRIQVKNQKTRWGSCSSKGNLNFNRHIIMAPPEIMDYVIVHELCHLKNMDHSAEFWRHVGQILPEYNKSRKWLKDNGYKLSTSFLDLHFQVRTPIIGENKHG